MQFIILVFIIFLSGFSSIWASNLNFHLSTGTVWGNAHHTNNLFLNSYVENSYHTVTTSSSSFLGAGIDYEWNKLFLQQPFLGLSVGSSFYYLNYHFSGTNSPLVNVGQFDKLSYSANNDSYVLMLEPKLLYTKYTWQPYLLLGAGVTWNKLFGYRESPADPALSAAPLPQPFRSMTMRNFAYEFGLGMQYFLAKTKTRGNVLLALDYRYINSGDMRLGTTPLQFTAKGPNFGCLKTQLLGVSLVYQL